MRFGCPVRLTSDQGTQFESHLFNSLLKYLGVAKSRTTPYHPQCNGIVERWHRSLKTSLRAMLECTGSTWIDQIPTVLLGLRAVARSDTGVSAAQMVYGNNIRLPGEFCANTKQQCNNDAELIGKIRESIHKIRPVSIKNRDQKSIFVHPDLNTCKFVFVRNEVERSSLEPSYSGPYKILQRTSKVFKIQLPHRETRVSIDRLKPAYILNEEDVLTSSLCPPITDDIVLPFNVSVPKQCIVVPTPTYSRSGRQIRKPVRFVN